MNRDLVLPNFFIAGVPKAGTSSLHNWLAAHPMALASREKETCFFADADSHIHRADLNVTHGLEIYAQQFDPSLAVDAPVIFESTPAYVYQKTALEMIPALDTKPRCLFVLREPGAQIRSVFSYYQNNWGHIPPDMQFDDYVSRARSGRGNFSGNELAENPLVFARYLDFLIPWQKALGAERMKVIIFEDMIDDPHAAICGVASWLGLPTEFYDTYDFAAENESYQPRSRLLQTLNVAVRARLPKGRFYDAMRSTYRKLNTKKPETAINMDTALSQIRAEMSAHNAELADRFTLDLSSWNKG